VFLYSNLKWSFDQVGLFMAVWVIFYGIVQALVPKLFPNISDSQSGAVGAKHYGVVLAFIPLVIAIGMSPEIIKIGINEEIKKLVLIGGLFLFGFIFAVNSSIHSFLIVAYSDVEHIALNVGFYYMANALGRLIGTLLSGLVFEYFGLSACLFVSSLLVCLAVLLTRPLGEEVSFNDQAT